MGRFFKENALLRQAFHCLFAIFVFATMVVLCLPKVAMADDVVAGAVVQCDAVHNRMLLRFGEFDGGVPDDGTSVDSSDLTAIPDTLGKQWQSISYAPTGECDFANGQKVSISITAGPFSHASSSEAFEMAINKHIVYANFLFYPDTPDTSGAFSGNGDIFPISAVEYDGKQLLECAPHYGKIGFIWRGQSGPAQPECHDVSNRLLSADKDLTQDEQVQLRHVSLKEKLTKSLSAFCKSLPPANSFIPMATSENIPPPFTVPTFIQAVPAATGEHVYGANIDINNDGKADTVFLVYDFSDYFSGSYLIAFTKTPNDAANFVVDMTNGNALDLGNDNDLTGNSVKVQTLKRWGALFISLPFGADGTRFVNNTPFEYNGETYIYTVPGNDQDAVPSAIVSEMMPDNSFKRVCTFP